MRTPLLFRWMQRWFWSGAVIFALFTIALASVNLAHGLPHFLALQRVNRLDATQLRKIADACLHQEKLGDRELSGDKIPREFQFLHPLSISFSPGSTWITLANRTCTYRSRISPAFEFNLFVALCVNSSTGSQIIECVSNAGRQHREILWQRDPVAYRQLNPVDRIITVAVNGYGYLSREWIVHDRELLIVDRISRHLNVDQINRQVALNDEQYAQIQSAVVALPANVRGKAFDLGAADGIELRLYFGADGREADRDIWLLNTWRSELEPLTSLLSGIAGTDCFIEFPDIIRRMSETNPRSSIAPVLGISMREFNRKRNWLPLPWWCLWPRLVDSAIP